MNWTAFLWAFGGFLVAFALFSIATVLAYLVEECFGYAAGLTVRALVVAVLAGAVAGVLA